MELVEAQHATSTAHSEGVKRRVAYFYDAEIGNYHYGQGHPMKVKGITYISHYTQLFIPAHVMSRNIY